MRGFIHRHLDPVDRLGEILFGLIMALGFTGAVRLRLEEPDNHALFTGILGCNIAWAIVDGVMYVLGELFERGRRARLARDLSHTPSDEEGLQRIGTELDDRLEPLLSDEERHQVYGWVLAKVRSSPAPRVRLHREDLGAGVAVGLLIVFATLPIVVPFLVVENPVIAARASHTVALVMLFWLGTWWGRMVGASPWRVGAGLTLLGAVLVLVCIALGG